MKEKNIEINMGVLLADDWIKINSDNIGFYRVNYSKEMFDSMLQHFDTDLTNFGSALDRFELVADSFALVNYCFSAFEAK
jgi:hypothetical protein